MPVHILCELDSQYLYFELHCRVKDATIFYLVRGTVFKPNFRPTFANTFSDIVR